MFGRERVAIDGLGVRLDEYQAFVGRQGVVVERAELMVAGGLHIEQGTHFLAGLEGILHDFLSVGTDAGVVFAIQHGLDAVDAFGAVGSVGHIV